ncbi:MAG: T9SS type A sorting domain-containing protein [Bacteroidales bacterium]|nr:T9SS type A sorting domain-containing protein [Bacteroidales bacterium]
MRVRFLVRVFIIILSFSTSVFSQIPVGEWRDHLPYSHCQKLVYGNNKIFCITNGGFFYYDLIDNSVNKLSKIQGLSDIGVSAACWDDLNNTLVLGYSNGNIDLITNNTVYNVPDLEQKQMSGDKKIYEIKVIDDLVFMACGFGIIVMDVVKREIKDTYRIGEGNKEIKINSIIEHNGFIYAASDAGLYKANKNANLLDAGNWNRELNIAGNDGAFLYLTLWNNKMYTLSGTYALFSEEEEGWILHHQFTNVLYSMSNVNNQLAISSNIGISLYNTEFTSSQYYPISRARDVLGQDGTIWVASFDDGLVQIADEQVNDGIYPDGPWYSYANDIEISDNIVWVGSSSAANRSGAGAYSFSEESGWTNHNLSTHEELIDVPNQAFVAIHPGNSSKVYVATYGYGLIEYNNQELINIYNQDNSPLRNVDGYSENYINLNGLAFDEEYNLWILSNIIRDPLTVLRPDGSWYTFEMKTSIFGKNQRVEDLIVTRDGYKCFLCTGGTGTAVTGFYVFDNNRQFTSQGNKGRFITVKNQEGEVMDNVYSIKEDLDGNVWVGTSKGPIVYYNFTDILTEDDPLGYQIIIPRNDGTEYGDALLGASAITAIDVDGANRKWFGTASSGIFLISDDGMKQIHNFTAFNSPMFSDRINDIEINQETGEVFIATDKGMLSFRSDATMGDDDFKDVYVFPNPVREGYNGEIIVTGLARNANVKITDISGNLVFETTALGGQAVWDGRTLSGKRVHTGVYLVFCTNEDASKTHMTKLLFIN